MKPDHFFDLVIVGAGPAGMAAAVEACKYGMDCIVIDEQSRFGGQIYRNISRQSLADKSILGPDYHAGLPLTEQFKASGCKYISSASVWQITAGGKVYFSVSGKSSSVVGKKILISTGAQERPMPIKGWTIPGVMTAGSAQVQMKNSGLVAEDAIFAGCGPLLYLIVDQYLKAGVKVKAIIDTSETKNLVAAARQWRGAMSGYKYLIKGISMLRRIKNAGVPIYKKITDIEAVSDSSGFLSKVNLTSNEISTSLDTEHLFLHQGIIPQVNLSMASECNHYWNEKQLCWAPVVDSWGQSSMSRLLIAGDGMGIGGANAAALRGRLAAVQLAHEFGLVTKANRDEISRPVFHQLNKELAFRNFIDTLYKPNKKFRIPEDDNVVVCRCENIHRGDLVNAIDRGCLGANQLKSFTRCGMGPCQGRQCGNTVSELMAELNENSVEEIGYYRLRAPVKPLTVSELASLAD